MLEALPIAATKMEVLGVAFPAFTKPPGSSNTLFLGGAGERGLEIEGKFIIFTVHGFYLEDKAVPSLMGKWKGKTAEELAGSSGFFRDIIEGPFEKLTRITLIRPLTGQDFSEKVADHSVAYMRAVGAPYKEAEVAAVEKFKEAFKGETFPCGSSMIFTYFASGSLGIGYSKGSSLPEVAVTVIENKALTEALLGSIIGEHGVSHALKHCLASRLSLLLNETNGVVRT